MSRATSSGSTVYSDLHGVDEDMYNLYHSAADHNAQREQPQDYTAAQGSNRAMQTRQDFSRVASSAVAAATVAGALCVYRIAAFKTEEAIDAGKGTARKLGQLAHDIGHRDAHAAYGLRSHPDASSALWTELQAGHAKVVRDM